jgi:hypothetical protein
MICFQHLLCAGNDVPLFQWIWQCYQRWLYSRNNTDQLTNAEELTLPFIIYKGMWLSCVPAIIINEYVLLFLPTFIPEQRICKLGE